MTLHEFASKLGECSKTLAALPNGELHSAQVCHGVGTEHVEYDFPGVVLEIQAELGDMHFTFPAPRGGKRGKLAKGVES